MSYLRRIAKETRTRFQPRRTRSLAFENTLRAEDAFVDAPPSAEPRPSIPQHDAQPATAPQRIAPPANIDRGREPDPPPTPAPPLTSDRLIRPWTDSSGQQPHRIDPVPIEARRQAPPTAMEIRQEYSDAIVDSVVFDPDEMPGPQAPDREPEMLRANPVREAPDPRQVESVMARVRALTRQRQLRTQPSAPDSTTADVPARLLPKQPEEVAATWPAEKPRPAPVRALYVADTKEKGVEQVQEPRLVRPPNTARQIAAQPNVRREVERDTVQVSFGSIIVHVEPETTPIPQAPQPARQRPAANSASDADNRWTRSFLDRN